MDAWTPPNGSTEVEPGWWIAPDGGLYSDNKALEPTEEEKQRASERRREEAAQRVRRDAALVPELVERIQMFEMQAYVCSLFLDTALTMLAEEQEQVRFLDDIIAGLVLEIPGAVS